MSRLVSLSGLVGLLACLLLLFVSMVRVQAAELVMVEQPGCAYCIAWHAEIAPAYPKTEQGQFAPLRVVTLKNIDESGIELMRRVNFTPTFLLVEDNQEIARIEGYAGSEFFWVLLDRLLLENTDYEAPIVDN